jgi:aryl-alcohol dehydrogenase-like predicted oxidoreductase
VTGAIVGARNARQVEETVGAADIRLSEQDLAEIEGKKS